MARRNGFAPCLMGDCSLLQRRLFVVTGKEGAMLKTTLALVCVLCVGLAAPLGAKDDEFLKFDGGIGVIPVSNVTVNPTTGVITVSPNAVRGVNPPGQIWVIEALKAEIESNGHIEVRGRGLLLGGGNSIGTNANQSVHATLICDPATPANPNPAQFSTPAAGVALDPDGDFRIDDMLSPPPPGSAPARCC
jgi:hypothetical protein